MKKAKVLVVFGAISMMALASCTKDFECECTNDFGNYTYTMTDSKRAAAAAVCEGEGIGGTEINGEPTEMGGDDCTLK